MRLRRRLVLAACLTLGLTSIACAKPLARRHQVGLEVGFWNQRSDVRTIVASGGVSTTVASSGGLGGVVYGYWFEENLALIVHVSGMVADVETSAGLLGVRSVTAVVAPILVGVKCYIPNPAPDSRLRPFIKGSAGPFVGHQSSTTVDTLVAVGEHTETAIGGQLGAGVDFTLGKQFLLSIAVANNFMADFSEPIGGSENYGGPEFSVGISILLGGGNSE